MGHLHFDKLGDVATGVGPLPEHAGDAIHLQACRRCAGIVDRLRRHMAIAADEARYDPPPWLVRHAAALFALARPRILTELPRVSGRIVFANRVQPIGVGVRGPLPTVRRTLFEAGDFAVDLAIDDRRPARQTIVVGQALNRAVNRPVAAAPVILTAGRRVIAKTVSNQLGEFVLQYAERRASRLRICVDDGRRCVDLDIDANIADLMPRAPIPALVRRHRRQRDLRS